ncbi:N-acetylglucosamine kinase [Silvibacterium dinghuense]|uniref:ATPase n=1 Tax=Silvibacterium dinghuense TaxID=1560006 RepID=A0A4Q1SIS0_9BACT|nr:BadF/BadG/BcrA/BcrD ATPase family protein [Silvibacterium dinghuense]RXS97299.1 ATPase [Silvibacterium dinghuense]GGG97892.1 N-acetylglucosamine kinase [Silvibacterium dinghuense]
MAFFLGFDAGGTKTTCALGDDHRELLRLTGGSIKPLRVTFEEAAENMRALLAEIAAQSGVDLRQVTASCIGTAGVRLPQTQQWMRDILQPHAGGEITIVGDEEVALDGVFPGQAGVLMIAGTGSNTLGRTSTGELIHVGGWGPALGDQGSGHWIGHQALRAAFHALDFSQPTLLLDRVRAFWGAATVGDVVNIANATPPPDFSKLAPIVLACALEGDAVAARILAEGGRLLGEDALEAHRRVRALEPKAKEPGIAFIGSIFERIAPMRESVIATIRRELPTAPIANEVSDAIRGALWRARQLAVAPAV